MKKMYWIVELFEGWVDLDNLADTEFCVLGTPHVMTDDLEYAEQYVKELLEKDPQTQYEIKTTYVNAKPRTLIEEIPSDRTKPHYEPPPHTLDDLQDPSGVFEFRFDYNSDFPRGSIGVKGGNLIKIEPKFPPYVIDPQIAEFEWEEIRNKMAELIKLLFHNPFCLPEPFFLDTDHRDAYWERFETYSEDRYDTNALDAIRFTSFGKNPKYFGK